MGILADDPAFDAEVAQARETARAELTHTSMAEIQRATAITWLGRCLAAFERFLATRDPRDLLDAGTFGEEACEHSSLVHDADFASRIANYFLYTQAQTLHASGLVFPPRLNPRAGQGVLRSDRW